jgi:uncharacterized protein (TIRG00374 family)
MYRLMKLVASLALLALLIFLLDWSAAAVAIRHADPFWVAAAFLISVAGVLISADKWNGLLRDSRVVIGFVKAARLYWIGMFFSNFLPTSVGGDAVRLMLTPSRGRTERVAGTILLERLTGLLIMLALSAIGLALRPGYFPDGVPHQLFIVTLVGLIACGLVLLIAPALLARLLPGIIDRLPPLLQRFFRKLHRVTITVAKQARHRSAMGRALLLSLPFYGTIILAQYFVLRAVDADVPLVDVLLLGAIVPLLTVLPISINGLGLAEGVFVAIYSAVGVVPEVALAAAVLRRVVDLANSALGGLFWLSHRRSEDPQPRDLEAREARGVFIAAHR